MKKYHFTAGPAILPLEVMQQAKEEWNDFQNTGVNIMELSHRGPEYEFIHEKAKETLRELLSIPENYEILFLQGGASLQFAMVPMNLLEKGKSAKYVLTGIWSEKALAEAKKIGNTAVSASGKTDHFRSLPDISSLSPQTEDAYLHITSNNTIYGTQWPSFQSFQHPCLVADMSSDILSRPIPTEQFGVIYAGAQKNLGPSGVTVVIIRKDLIKNHPHLPSMLDYSVHAKSRSLYNTPPTFSIYLLHLVLEWTKHQGGAAAMEKRNQEKASLLYRVIDESEGFYKGIAAKHSRSLMNITFNLDDPSTSDHFKQKLKEHGFFGLSGHRSIGGFRASLYNSVTMESCQALAHFMEDFKVKYGK